MTPPAPLRRHEDRPVLSAAEAFDALAHRLVEQLASSGIVAAARSRKARQAKEDELREVIAAAARDLFGEDASLCLVRTPDAELRPVVEAVVERIPEAVAARREALSSSRIDALVDVYLASDPLAGVQAELERDNAEARARYLEEVPTLTSQDVAKLAAHEARNRSATASRWKAQRRIFSVSHRGRDLYPAFQFSDGAPRPVVGKVLAELPASMSPWQVAFWFWGGNGWLGGAAPVDRLADEDALVEAARREGETWAG